MKRIRVGEEAERELREALLRYEQAREGYGRKLWDEVQAGLQGISEHPAVGSLVQRVRVRLPVRIFNLDRFPYSIVYREHEDYLEILAIAHQSRRPS